MSSILRALKKLENEPRHLEETQPLDSKFVSLADTEPQRPVSSIFLMVIGTGIVCGLVILAGWWLFSKKNQLPPAITPEISQQSPKLEESPAPSLNLNKVVNSAVSEKTEKLSMKVPETSKATDQAMESQPSNFEKPALRVTGQENIPPVETKRQPDMRKIVSCRRTRPKTHEPLRQTQRKLLRKHQRKRRRTRSRNR